MEEHPIQGLMTTAMESIKQMVDVNTVVGDAVETKDGTVIVPVSRVTAGFAAGGAEYQTSRQVTKDGSDHLPFGGGSGAGVSVQPVGFLVVAVDSIRFLAVDDRAVIDRVLDVAPDFIERVGSMFRGNGHLNGHTRSRVEPVPSMMTTSPTSSVKVRKDPEY